MLKWTKEKPKEDGFYFYANAGEITVTYVDMESETVALLDFPGDENLCFMDGKWAGPIPEPMEDVE